MLDARLRSSRELVRRFEGCAAQSCEPRAKAVADAGPHRGGVALRLADGARARRAHLEMTTRAAAAHGQGFARAGGEQALVFESLQRRVDGANRVVAIGALAQILAHREAVGVVAQASYGEEGGELEGAKGGRHKY